MGEKYKVGDLIFVCVGKANRRYKRFKVVEVGRIKDRIMVVYLDGVMKGCSCLIWIETVGGYVEDYVNGETIESNGKGNEKVE